MTITIPANRARGLEPGDEYVCGQGRLRVVKITNLLRCRVCGQPHFEKYSAISICCGSSVSPRRQITVEPLPPLVVEMPQKA